MEKENRFKLFMPPRLSAGQVSAGRSQGSKSLPVSDTISQEVKLCSEVDEENPETMNELFSKLYKEAEKIKQWKLTVETELNQKERKLQENRKIIEAQKKAVQELQFENEKLHLKLEDEICENKDLLKEAAASRHLCNLLKETCTRFAEKTSKYEQEKEATIQLYEELHSNIERMTVAFEELRVQAENDRLEMSLKESQVSKEHLRAELEEAKISLQKAEFTQKNLETEFHTTVKTLIQVTGEKEEQEEECKKMKALLAALTEEFETSVANLKSLLQEEQNRLKKAEDDSKLLTLELQNKSAEVEEMTKVKCDKEVQLEELSTCTAEKEQDYLKQLVTLKTDLEQEALKNEQLTVYLSKLSLEKEQTAQEKNAVAAELQKLQEQQETKQLVENLEEANSQLRNELESLKEKMAKTGEEMKSTLDEREENQMENKTKCIEELQQENKVLKKKITAESKKSNTYEGKVNKLQLEMENMNKQHKEEVDMYQKDIETRKVNANKLHEEVEKMRLLCDETAMIQRETDARCQHKITEMMALMEKHKNEYDKMIEEKDAEELSCLKRELSSLKEQLKAEMEEKENLVKEHSGSMIAESEKKHKTCVIKTPPVDKMQSGRSTNLPAEQSSRKKQKVLVQLDTESSSSEHTDLLSPGSALKLKTMRRMHKAGWTALSKTDRKRKIKDAVKLFA
ncbi:synaptonemal complex protein 1-like [Ammospiza maritima maritima]